MANELPEYLSRVRHLGCCVCQYRPCEPHHAGDRGLGQRAHDDTAIPLCWVHHRQWHDNNGHFKGWDRDARRLWVGLHIDRVRKELA